MNRIIIFLLIFLPVLLIGQSEAFNIMTFNIRFPNPGDGFNYWPHRKEMAASMIRYHDADLVGVQEAFPSQLKDLTDRLPGFKWVGLCRTDGSQDQKSECEFSAILYQSDRFELLQEETFWLSESPEKAGSKSWDSALPRIVTWAQFKDKKTGKTFFHFNTHFDHVGVEARKNSASLIKKKVAAIAGDSPVLITGDFNCVPTDDPYRILTEKEGKNTISDAIFLSRTPHHGPLGTWTNAFQFPGVPGRRIDYIFVNNQVQVLKHAILSDSWSGRLPSDHLPVIAKVLVGE